MMFEGGSFYWDTRTVCSASLADLSGGCLQGAQHAAVGTGLASLCSRMPHKHTRGLWRLALAERWQTATLHSADRAKF